MVEQRDDTDWIKCCIMSNLGGFRQEEQVCCMGMHRSQTVEKENQDSNLLSTFHLENDY